MNVAVSRLSVCLATLLICEARASDEQMKLTHERMIRSLEEWDTTVPQGFWERFQSALDHRVGEVFAEQLHSFNVMGWNLRHPGQNWSAYLQRGDRAVQKSLSRSLEYASRDAAVGLPIVGWLETQGDELADFFVDSVDAVEEEAVAPTDPWYGPTERAWWNSLTGKRVFRYGIRPFRADPYTYVSMRVREGNRLSLLGHVRYYFEDFEDHRFELAVSAPLAHGFILDIGTSYQIGSDEEEKKLVVKLFKPLRCGGILHAGMELGEDPNVMAGFSIPW